MLIIIKFYFIGKRNIPSVINVGDLQKQWDTI